MRSRALSRRGWTTRRIARSTPRAIRASWLLALGVAACSSEFRFDDGAMDATTETDAAPASLTCEDDPDCRHPGLHCAVEIGRCVECLDRSQCRPGRPHCHIASHRCVECASPRDCRPGSVCDRRSSRCLSLCRDASECPEELAGCDTMRGVCVECVLDIDCRGAPGGGRCERSSGRCVECREDVDCPAERPRCDLFGGRCASCLSSEDCEEPAPVCEPLELTCEIGA